VLAVQHTYERWIGGNNTAPFLLRMMLTFPVAIIIIIILLAIIICVGVSGITKSIHTAK